MSNPSTSPAADMLVRMAAESAARIAEADGKAERALAAFAAGKFEEYFRAEYEAVEKAIGDEYDRTNDATDSA